MNLDRRSAPAPRWMKVLATILSFMLEKNPHKTLNTIAPFVLSGSRVIVATFTFVCAWRIGSSPNIGWPEATLALGCIFALPLLAALDKVSPKEVVEFGAKIVERFGVGAVAAPHPGMDQNEKGDYHDDDPN